MFETLSERIGTVLDRLTRRGALTETDVGEAMREVRLLVEVLADRASVRKVGVEETRLALLTLAGSKAPEAAMAAGVGSTAVRLDLLARPAPNRLMTAAMYAYAVGLILVPLGLLALAWTSR